MLAKETNLQKFQASSPPSAAANQNDSSKLSQSSPLADTSQQTAGSEGPPPQEREPVKPPQQQPLVSHIAILPSSLPSMHRAFMIQHRAKKAAAAAEAARLADGRPTAGELSAAQVAQASAQATSNAMAQQLRAVDLNTPPVEGQAQSQEQQAATASHLKPHSRSVVALDSSESKLKEMSTLTKKPRTIRWQFGIRSRNNPAEAIAALFKALTAMDCEFEQLTPDEIRRPRKREDSSQTPGMKEYEQDQHSWSDEEGDVDQHHERGRSRDRDAKYGSHNDWGYEVAKDPWVINGRFRKDRMCPPGVMNPSSAHSSRVDLTAVGEELARRERARGSDTNLHSLAHDNAAYAGPGAGPQEVTSHTPEHSLWVYFAIQLYQIEENFFLVDFKSSGYERIVPTMIKEVKVHLGKTGWGWKPLKSGELVTPGLETRFREVLQGAGRVDGEKKATSPFPFLDVASQLVAYLAEGRTN